MTSSIYGADGVTQLLAGPGISLDPAAGVGIVTVSAAPLDPALSGVTTFNTRVGAVTLVSADVTAALGYTPLSSAALATKQDVLVSGTNIKTVNGSTLMGSGNLAVLGAYTTAAATIAELKTVSKATYQFVQVAGYYTPGDGGGGLYYLAADTTSADNAGSIIVAADGGRWFLDVTLGAICADQFGADATGASNASTRLQTLIDFCQANNLTPYLRKGGIYKLTTGLTLKQGQSATDTKSYSATLYGNSATLVPYGAITALAVVPRCLLADQNTGRQSAHIEITSLNIDGFGATAGAQPFKIGAPTYTIYCADWGVIKDVVITNFNTTSALTYFKEAGHIVIDRLIHKWSTGSLLLESTTNGSFCGDLIFNAFQGEGTEAVPPVKLLAGTDATATTCQVRGIKFNQADIYGAGTLLQVKGTGGSQVGDVWFNSCQFDSNGAAAGAKVIFLEANETSAIFQVHIRDIYAVGYSGTVVYAVSNGASTIYMCDVSGGAINDCTPHTTYGNAIICLQSVEAFSVNNVAFNKIYGGPSSSTAAVILVKDSTNCTVTGTIMTQCSAVPTGIAVGGTSNYYTITDNNLQVGSVPVNDFTAAVRTKTIANNIGVTKVDNYLGGYVNLINGSSSTLLQSQDGAGTFTDLYVTGSKLVFASGATPTETLRINKDASAVVDITSTTGGVRFPRLTTTQKNAVSGPAAGLVVYDTTLNQLNYYDGSTWSSIGGGSGGAGSFTSLTVSGTSALGGNTNIVGDITFGGAGGSSYGLLQTYNGGWKDMFQTAMRFAWATGLTTTTEKMRLLESGELLVGYGTTNGSSYKLQVNSQIFATSSTVATSDMRYKENVKPITGALDIVTRLNPVTFSWKKHAVHNFSEGATTGFLAQDVKAVLKDTEYADAIVKTNECTLPTGAKEEFLGIAEGNLISILTAALKELNKDHQDLKALLASKGIL
jgi:Chaperone of endosialidase